MAPPVHKNKKKLNSATVELSGLMSAGKAKLKKKIRDIQRTLRRENLPSNIRIDNERALKALSVELEEKDSEQRAKVIAKKYHMVRFFERKKAIRKYKQALKTVEELESNETSEKKDLKKAKKVLRHCQVDLAYIVNFPKTEKYVSLYPSSSEADSTDANVKKGLLETEKKRQAYKKQFEKMLDEGTLPVKIEDVLQGKKSDNKTTQKSTAITTAIDAPEAKKVEEQDEFFE